MGPPQAASGLAGGQWGCRGPSLLGGSEPGTPTEAHADGRAVSLKSLESPAELAIRFQLTKHGKRQPLRVQKRKKIKAFCR